MKLFIFSMTLSTRKLVYVTTKKEYKMFTKIIEKRTRLPILHTVKVKDGIATATDCDIFVSTPCNAKDGIYEYKLWNLGIEKLSELDIEMFPVTPDFTAGTEKATLTRDELIYLSRTMSEDETRYYLNGINFSGHGIASTNGHGLSYIKRDTGLKQSYILPRKVVDFMLHFKVEEYTVFFDDYKAKIEIEGYTIITKLIDGAFPDFLRVIPADDNFKVFKYNNEKYLKALPKIRKVAKACGEKIPSITFTPHGVKVNGFEYAVGSFPEYSCGFNAEYFSYLPSGDFYLSSDSSPSKVIAGDKISVLMPRRV